MRSTRPDYELRVYGDNDTLPDALEDMFAEELAYSREPLPKDRPDRGKWSFATICAEREDGRVIAGLHMDMGPINSGPLADERYAVIERITVLEQYQGEDERRAPDGLKRLSRMKASVIGKAVEVAKTAGCVHIQTNISWTYADEVDAFRQCGFALVDLTGPGEKDEYFVVKPLRD